MNSSKLPNLDVLFFFFYQNPCSYIRKMEDNHEFGGNLITFERNPRLWGVIERLLLQVLSPDLAAGSQPTFSCSFGAVKAQPLLLPLRPPSLCL